MGDLPLPDPDRRAGRERSFAKRSTVDGGAPRDEAQTPFGHTSTMPEVDERRCGAPVAVLVQGYRRGIRVRFGAVGVLSEGVAPVVPNLLSGSAFEDAGQRCRGSRERIRE
jgi:hypothetical protein